MKCVDCLPLLEEFFDGEVDDRTSERMREHLAACSGCAVAFDALRAEQELFLRYDRELEVTPALWHGVRAAIAAEDLPEAKPRPRSFLTLWRGQLAAALALFAARPALASSLALLAVGVTAGALWYANSHRAPNNNLVADNGQSSQPAPVASVTSMTSNATPTPDEIALGGGGDEPAGAGPGVNVGGAGVIRRANAPAAESAAPRGRVDAKTETPVSVVTFAEVNLEAADDDPLPAAPPRSFADVKIADAAALLDPEDEAVARHVERAQVLLRSIKNTRPADGEGDLAYERELARKLLAENVSLQLDADADDNKKAKRVLTELEPYLNDIANLRDQPARGELRSIRERMEKQEIIATLHVYDD